MSLFVRTFVVILIEAHFPQVLVKTTLGDLDIELWSKEAPLACRNFVQLCMEDYYNGTIFHRIVQGKEDDYYCSRLGYNGVFLFLNRLHNSGRRPHRHWRRYM